MEAGSGGGDELDAVTLDFLFELDAWLLDEGGSEPVGGQALPLSSIPNEPLVNAPLTLEPPHSQPCSLSSIFTAPVAPPEAQTTSGESTPSPTGAQPPRKKPKSSTQRQKEELAFLRAKVKDLEDQRRQLQSRQEGREKRQEEEAATGISNNRDGILMWKSVAERQQQVKEKSEAENERLRMMVDGQIKLVESMERILHKQQVCNNHCHPTAFSRCSRLSIFLRTGLGPAAAAALAQRRELGQTGSQRVCRVVVERRRSLPTAGLDVPSARTQQLNPGGRRSRDQVDLSGRHLHRVQARQGLPVRVPYG